jgi:hypothetical protein
MSVLSSSFQVLLAGIRRWLLALHWMDGQIYSVAPLPTSLTGCSALARRTCPRLFHPSTSSLLGSLPNRDTDLRHNRLVRESQRPKASYAYQFFSPCRPRIPRTNLSGLLAFFQFAQYQCAVHGLSRIRLSGFFFSPADGNSLRLENSTLA